VWTVHFRVNFVDVYHASLQLVNEHVGETSNSRLMNQPAVTCRWIAWLCPTDVVTEELIEFRRRSNTCSAIYGALRALHKRPNYSGKARSRPCWHQNYCILAHSTCFYHHATGGRRKSFCSPPVRNSVHGFASVSRSA